MSRLTIPLLLITIIFSMPQEGFAQSKKTEKLSPSNTKSTSIQSNPRHVPQVGKFFRDCNDCPEMVVLPGGSFTMGSNSGEKSEFPAHSVELDSFAVSTTEITVGQWGASSQDMWRVPQKYDKSMYVGKKVDPLSVCNNNKACAYIFVSLRDADEYIKRLNKKTGRNYRLLSEAEFEYACKAGEETQYCGSNNADEVAILNETKRLRSEVAVRRPNAFGLYDMSGGAWELVSDCWEENYASAKYSENKRVQQPKHCRDNVIRGGIVADQASTVTTRKFEFQVPREKIGLRIALSAREPAGKLSISTTPVISGSTVLIDGQSVGHAPISIPVNPGSHTIAILAEGYQADQQILEVLNKSEHIVLFDLKQVDTFAIKDNPGKTFADCPTCPEMVSIPKGSFVMGSKDGPKEEGPVRTVRISPFAISKTEITLGLWREIMADDTGPKMSQDLNEHKDSPVSDVSIGQVKEFLKRLSLKSGRKYRLPSEAEWEYACRGGKNEAFCGSDDPDEVAVTGNKKIAFDLKVASLKPNAFGLYDMSGNLYELVEDCWSLRSNLKGAPTNGAVWIPSDCSNANVIRGGSKNRTIKDARSTARWNLGWEYRHDEIGFRVATSGN